MEKSEMTERFVVLTDFITASLQEGKELVLEQAPLLVQELILAKRIEHTIGLLIGIGLLVAAIKLTGYTRKNYDDWTAGCGDPRAFLYPIGLCLLYIFVSVVLMVDINGLIYVWFAPRVFILEYMANLL